MHDTYIVGSARGKARNASLSLVGIVNSFAACGFFKYHGMTAEQFLWAVIKSELLYPKKLVFQSEDIYYSCMQETISLGEKNQKDGAEIIKEREQRAEAKQRKKRKGRSDAFD